MMKRPAAEKVFFWSLIIMVMVSGAGCERTGTRSKSVPGQESGGAGMPLTVKTAPEAPAVSTDIQAVCSCANDPSAQYRWELNGQVLQDERGSTLQPKNRFRKGDRITVTVSASGATASATAVIGNTTPVITAVVLQPEVIYRGVNITAVPTVIGDDGDEVRFQYRWSINGNELPEDTAVLSGERFRRSDRITLAVTPFDADGPGLPYTTRPIVIPNGPPRFTSSPVLDFQSETYEYQAVAVDPDGDPLTYILVSGPVAMSVDPVNGTVRLQIRKEHAGAHTVGLEVQDPAGMKASQTFTLNLTIP